MKTLKSVYKNPDEEKEEIDFGHINIILDQYLIKNRLTRNKLAKQCGTEFQTIDKYFKNKQKNMIDIILFAKICFVLDCDLNEIIEYCPPR